MMKLYKQGLFALLLIFTTPVFAQNPVNTIPEFTFFRLDGTPFTRSHLSKTNKIIFIFFDVTCHHCQKEAQTIGKNYSAFKGTSFYMVSLDEPPAIRQFMSTYGKGLYEKKNVTLLQDKNRQFIPKFYPSRYPAIFVYSPQGKLIKYFDSEIPIQQLLKAAQ